jgi:hypothetical protein
MRPNPVAFDSGSQTYPYKNILEAITWRCVAGRALATDFLLGFLASTDCTPSRLHWNRFPRFLHCEPLRPPRKAPLLAPRGAQKYGSYSFQTTSQRTVRLRLFPRFVSLARPLGWAPAGRQSFAASPRRAACSDGARPASASSTVRARLQRRPEVTRPEGRDVRQGHGPGHTILGCMRGRSYRTGFDRRATASCCTGARRARD